MLDEEIKEVVKSTDSKLTTLIHQVSGFETLFSFQKNQLDDQNDRLKHLESKVHKVELDVVRFSGMEKEMKCLTKFVERTVETSEAMRESFSKAYQDLLNKQQKNTFFSEAGSRMYYIVITGIVTALITWLATGNPK